MVIMLSQTFITFPCSSPESQCFCVCRWGAGGQSQPEWSYRAGGWDAVRPHPCTLHPDKPRHCTDGRPPAKHTHYGTCFVAAFVPFDRLESLVHSLLWHWYWMYWKYMCLTFALLLYKSCNMRRRKCFWLVFSDLWIAVGEVPTGRFWLLPSCVLWKSANASNRWVITKNFIMRNWKHLWLPTVCHLWTRSHLRRPYYLPYILHMFVKEPFICYFYANIYLNSAANQHGCNKVRILSVKLDLFLSWVFS